LLFTFLIYITVKHLLIAAAATVVTVVVVVLVLVAGDAPLAAGCLTRLYLLLDLANCTRTYRQCIKLLFWRIQQMHSEKIACDRSYKSMFIN